MYIYIYIYIDIYIYIYIYYMVSANSHRARGGNMRRLPRCRMATRHGAESAEHIDNYAGSAAADDHEETQWKEGAAECHED